MRDRFERREIKLGDLLFTKQLNKHPKEYNRGETIPHVKVALDRLRAGEKPESLVNHTIYYVVCKPKDKQQDSLAKCSFDGKEYERSQSKFYLIQSYTNRADRSRSTTSTTSGSWCSQCGGLPNTWRTSRPNASWRSWDWITRRGRSSGG